MTKETLFLLTCALLFSTAACAQEDNLYAVGLDTVNLLEAYAGCALQENACSSDDAATIQTEARNIIRKTGLLVKSGDVRRIWLRHEEALTLRMRTQVLHQRLLQGNLLNAPCNLAIKGVEVNIYNIVATLAWMCIFFEWGVTKNPSYYFGIVLCLPFLVFFMVATLTSFLLLPACLFWWL